MIGIIIIRVYPHVNSSAARSLKSMAVPVKHPATIVSFIPIFYGEMVEMYRDII